MRHFYKSKKFYLPIVICRLTLIFIVFSYIRIMLPLLYVVKISASLCSYISKI